MMVKCMNCKKHKELNNIHTCSSNINVYVLGVLQEPMVTDCFEYEPIEDIYKKNHFKPWRK